MGEFKIRNGWSEKQLKECVGAYVYLNNELKQVEHVIELLLDIKKDRYNYSSTETKKLINVDNCHKYLYEYNKSNGLYSNISNDISSKKYFKRLKELVKEELLFYKDNGHYGYGYNRNPYIKINEIKEYIAIDGNECTDNNIYWSICEPNISEIKVNKYELIKGHRYIIKNRNENFVSEAIFIGYEDIESSNIQNIYCRFLNDDNENIDVKLYEGGGVYYLPYEYQEPRYKMLMECKNEFLLNPIINMSYASTANVRGKPNTINIMWKKMEEASNYLIKAYY